MSWNYLFFKVLLEYHFCVSTDKLSYFRGRIQYQTERKANLLLKLCMAKMLQFKVEKRFFLNFEEIEQN